MSEIKEFLETPIEDFWPHDLKYINRDHEMSLEDMNKVSNLVFVSPFNDIYFRIIHSQEYINFIKNLPEIPLINYYLESLIFMKNIDKYDRDTVFKLSQHIYYEIYYYKFDHKVYPPSRSNNINDIKKLLLLEDCLNSGVEIKEDDKLGVQRIFRMAYALGEWGCIRGAELIFNLIHKTLSHINDGDLDLDNLKINSIFEDRYIPLSDSYMINCTTPHMERYLLSLVHGLGRVYQLNGEYQKAINIYKSGLNIKVHHFIGRNRYIEDLSEAYKCATILKDAGQKIEIFELIKSNFKDMYEDRFFIVDINAHLENINDRHTEWAREPSLVASMIRHKIYNDLF